MISALTVEDTCFICHNVTYVTIAPTVLALQRKSHITFGADTCSCPEKYHLNFQRNLKAHSFSKINTALAKKKKRIATILAMDKIFLSVV